MSASGRKAFAGKPVLGFTLAGIAVLGLAVLLQNAPGYMDAEYYYAGGLQLAGGHGFTDPFLWNYLDQPGGLPHPSHTYWMPLASILAFLGMKLAGAGTFLAARWPFVLLAALIPWLTYRLALLVDARPSGARLAAWLAVFPGFYAIFTTLTETFVLYMLGGASFFIVLSLRGERWKTRLAWLRYGLLGLAAGWMHASRADGLMWLGLAGLVWLVDTVRAARAGNGNGQRAVLGLLALGAGYGLIMGAWYARNIQLYGSLFAAGSARTLWLTDYDQTYTFAADSLTFQNWLAAGWAIHLKARLAALGLNLKNLLAVQGAVFLLPLILIGLWKKRRNEIVRWGTFGWALTLFAMTVIFPFSGSRGGYLHSGAAFQPLGWACAALGLEAAIDAGVARRGWQRKTAWRFFAGGAVVLAALMTAGLFWARVVQPGVQEPAWSAGLRAYQAVGGNLEQMAIPAEDLFVVNNPPEFFLATGRSSIVIPDGDESELLAAAQKYGAKYLILDANNPKLEGLYQQETNNPNFELIKTIESMKLYRIRTQPSQRRL